MVSNWQRPSSRMSPIRAPREEFALGIFASYRIRFALEPIKGSSAPKPHQDDFLIHQQDMLGINDGFNEGTR